MSTTKRGNGDEPLNKDDQKPGKDDESQLSKLRLPQNFDNIVGGKKLTQHIPITKPEKQWFVRTHDNDDMWFPTAILDFVEDGEAYIVEAELWDELANDIRPKVLIPTITSQGHLLLWPILLPSDDGRINEWSRTALHAAEYAKKEWVRVVSNMSIGSYEIIVAATMYPDPSWPDFGLEEWIRLGFRDRIIKSTDHPVVRRLRGEL